MTNRDVVAFFNAKQDFKYRKLPIKFAFAIKLNYDKLKSVAEVYNSQLGDIRNKYGIALSENGSIKSADDSVVLTAETLSDFSNEVNELLDIEIPDCDISKVDMLTLEKCDDMQYDHLTVTDLECLSFMIED